MDDSSRMWSLPQSSTGPHLLHSGQKEPSKFCTLRVNVLVLHIYEVHKFHVRNQAPLTDKSD